MAEILKGAPVAAAITENLKQRTEALIAKGIVPTLAIVRVGENTGALSYERGAVSRCEKVGVTAQKFILPADCTQAELEEIIRHVNEDDKIHGCLLFRPLPRQMDERAVCELLCPEKDVDCITNASLTGVFTGNSTGFAPCTAQAVVEILNYYQIPVSGARVTVVGRSLVIGRPVSMLLMRQNATVTMCHTGTRDLPAACREAEILVAAAGKAEMIGETCVNPQQVIIDVGINTGLDGKLCGDVNYAKVEPTVKAITPVPGGVGAVTTAVLLKHLVEAAEGCL